ncbi:thiosulfate reductase cytochrome b subunit [Nitrobacteraceae bacterium AZCC 1564]
MGSVTSRLAQTRAVHPLWARVMHWINALAMIVMVLSGWQIYDASPLFNFRFPHSITLGGWLGGGLLWHFAAMWILAINGLFYIALGLITGRFRKKLFPIRVEVLINDTKAALHGTLSHEDIAMYNDVQRLLYVGIITVAVVIVLSGLSMWKPVQFQTLAALFGGYDGARYVHFICMGMIVAFLAVHVTLALLFPKSIRAMLVGS